MKFEELNQLKKEIEQDLLITDQNCKDKILQVPSLFQKWLSIFIKESQMLKKLKLELAQIEADKFKYYKEHYERQLTKAEIEYYVNLEEPYLKKKRDVNQQESICQFLEMTVQNFKSLPYSIKSYVDLRLFLGGSR